MSSAGSMGLVELELGEGSGGGGGGGEGVLECKHRSLMLRVLSLCFSACFVALG